MATIKTTNPFTGKLIKKYERFSEEQINNCLQKSAATFPAWAATDITERATLIKKVADLLLERTDSLARLMTEEMGKPIVQSRAEIEKCAWVCDFYAKNGAKFLSDALIETDAVESFISYDPLGTVLAIMPWNYPFWQVLRFAAPTLTAGNTAILKHAENVTGCALALEQLFVDAGYPEGCFQAILADHEAIEELIGHEVVQAVSLTGSEKAGRAIAEIAGKNLKKTVLELGGNNACVVWEDADLDEHLDIMVKARMQNNGQSCIAAKRFIVVETIYDEFLDKFKKKVAGFVTGSPMDEDTYISVMAREDLAKGLEDQVKKSVEMGAEVVMGNTRKGAYFEPTLLTKVTAEMPVFKEETFGPVAAIIKVRDRQAAIDMARNSDFGLGTMLFTQDIEEARKAISQIPDGAFFINEMVKSDPRLPFGGTKNSGYGRELSREGILAFVNEKTVYIN
ncbi:NAD-dependent succinate-semialdehyde dehydrogenase [Flavobacteriaceae bacterium TP-CH-4]|uniref:NAD-dependent succinate-semialdehyde dehydrogenase n=1 Tax=Pelagihabitans pacificus TaxID=2696054 RepID=A0A967AXK0_9FLAO|nr:NAD-dependent succinate-semialdehyde dehydrogenase [Pelagihabitans pacificus]NHF61003.1 NAD-dependent succinate-semialdehyde dehydrogenase [Pelagihabitans pacificus]